MPRIFKVWLNLDTAGAALDDMAVDAEVADWTRGFMRGARGLPARSGSSTHYDAGWKQGSASAVSAAEFFGSQAAKAKRGAEARWHKTQTMPTGINGALPQALPGAMPIQYPVSNIEVPAANIQRPDAKAHAKASAAAADEDLFQGEPQAVARVLSVQTFMEWKNKYRKYLGMNPQRAASDADWATLFNRNGWDDMVLAADFLIKQIKPGSKHLLWPDQFSKLEKDQ
jgi:hypothetical protein